MYENNGLAHSYDNAKLVLYEVGDSNESESSPRILFVKEWVTKVFHQDTKFQKFVDDWVVNYMHIGEHLYFFVIPDVKEDYVITLQQYNLIKGGDPEVIKSFSYYPQPGNEVWSVKFFRRLSNNHSLSDDPIKVLDTLFICVFEAPIPSERGLISSAAQSIRRLKDIDEVLFFSEDKDS